jgi:hypothetical protein
MKNLSYFFTALGVCLMFFTLYIMFNPGDYQDRDFALSLFFGILISFIGFTLETHTRPSDSRYQRDHKRRLLRTSYSVVILSAIMVVLTLIWL